jgi:hypothetical protein
MKNNYNDDRAVLDMFEMEVLGKMAKGKSGYIVNEHDLVLRAKLTNSNNVVKLKVVKDSNTTNREQPLEQTDIFCMTHGLLGIQKMKRLADGTIVPMSEILTFVDPSVFNGVNAKGEKEVEALSSIYDAKLQLDTSRLTRVGQFSTRNFVHVPTRENGINAYGTDHVGRGFYPFVRFSVFNGKATNKLEIELREELRGGIQGDDIDVWNELVFICKGFLAVDASEDFAKFLGK